MPRLLTSGARPAWPAPALGASDQGSAGVSFRLAGNVRLSGRGHKTGDFRDSRAMQVKRRMEAVIYRALGVPRNDALERVLAEASRGQIPAPCVLPDGRGGRRCARLAPAPARVRRAPTPPAPAPRHAARGRRGSARRRSPARRARPRAPARPARRPRTPPGRAPPVSPRSRTPTPRSARRASSSAAVRSRARSARNDVGCGSRLHEPSGRGHWLLDLLQLRLHPLDHGRDSSSSSRAETI